MHGVVQRLERLLTLLVLLCLGIAMSRGLLDALDWRGVLAGAALVCVVRPLSGVLSLLPYTRSHKEMNNRERLVTAFFGIRGVGSLFYLAYASQKVSFADLRWLWATVAFTIALSVLVDGTLAKPAMPWLERNRPHPQDAPAGAASAAT